LRPSRARIACDCLRLIDDPLSPTFRSAMPSRRSSAAMNAQRFIEAAQGDEPELARSYG
jgi:hypothetical protein